MEEKQFDLAIHLVGGQSYPNLMGMRDLNAKRHLLLASDKTDKVSKKLRKLVQQDGSTVQSVILSAPFDIDKIISEFIPHLSAEDQNVAVNVTGGTKPMAFATMTLNEVEKRRNVDYFYYDTETERRFHWPVVGSERRTEATLFSNLNLRIKLDDFIKLFDFPENRSNEDYDNLIMERRELTQKIWEYRWVITNVKSMDKTLQTEASDLNSIREKEIWKKTHILPNSLHRSYSGYNRITRRQETVEVRYDEGKSGQIIFNGRPMTISSDFVDFLGYVGGKWFEEYVYLTLKKIQETGKLLEVRPNVAVHSELTNYDMQEFDLLATDGVRLFIVECKAGNLEKTYVTKLRDLVSKYAGSFGVGILVAQKFQNTKTTYPNNDKSDRIKTIFDEIDNSKSVYCFHGDKCVNLLEQYMPDLGTPKGEKGPIFS